MSRIASLALPSALMLLSPASASARDTWVLVDGRELVEVASGQRVDAGTSDRRAVDIAQGLDGSMLVLRTDGIHRLAPNGELRMLAPLHGHERREHLAVLPDGRFLVWSHDAFAIWDGVAWHETTREAISESVDAIYEVLWAGETLWVITAGKVFTREGDRWIGMEPGYHGAPEHVFMTAAVNRFGQVMVPHINALTFWEPDPAGSPGFREVDLSSFASQAVPIISFSRIAPLPDGGALLYGVTASTNCACRFVSVPRDGDPSSFEPAGTEGDCCEPSVRDMAVDARGRTWLATEAGLFVYSKRGELEGGPEPWVEGDISAVLLTTRRPPRPPG